MKTLRDTLTEAAATIDDMAKDTMNFGFTFKECFPAEILTWVEHDGQPYKIKITVTAE